MQLMKRSQKNVIGLARTSTCVLLKNIEAYFIRSESKLLSWAPKEVHSIDWRPRAWAIFKTRPGTLGTQKTKCYRGKPTPTITTSPDRPPNVTKFKFLKKGHRTLPAGIRFKIVYVTALRKHCAKKLRKVCAKNT